ncbi:MAG: hypothetical protein ACI87E_004295, partial [Mariniblastus sp.]
MDQLLTDRLEPVVRRIRVRRIGIALAVVFGVATLVVAWMVYQNRIGQLDASSGVVWLLGATALASIVALVLAVVNAKSATEIAADIERRHPELDASLLTAIEIEPNENQSYDFLEQDVLRTAITHSYQNSWPALVPAWQLLAAPLAGAIGLLAFAITILSLVLFSKPLPVDPTIAFADAAVDATNFVISVEPGNAEVERGTSLLVLARFEQSIPPEASLVMTDAEGAESRIAMNKSLDDPVFGARIASISKAVDYRIEFADQQSDEFQVSVYELPQLIRADATLKYPAFAELDDKIVQDFRRVSAVEGTQVELTFFVNKPITSAILFPQGTGGDLGEPIEVESDPNDPRKLVVNLTLLESRKYELELTDTTNRENRTPPKFVLNVLGNRLPDLKLIDPTRDVVASPIEEIQLAASAWDDFGLKAFGLRFGIPGQEEQELLLQQTPAGKNRKRVDHLLELEALQAKPDDLVTYHFWAEDLGSDGERRRVSSDMFFAEVRHFEEIFRQGQAPPGGEQPPPPPGEQGSQNAEQAQELAELQKDIINGIWKVIRRERSAALTDQFLPDTELLAASQRDALESLAELVEKLQDPQSKAYVEPVRESMNEVVSNLMEAKQDQDSASLKPALSSAQAAYQGLLKLRAREHEVVLQQQQQPQPGQPQQNNRSQQQLEQLNLEEDESRYENEKTAQVQSEQAQEQQEDRQVLNRLRELARRQSDLNERVKELQSALEEAESQEAKEEIERRLKSLQEQQEQLLRDTDELLDRMQEEQNQQRMAEQSEKLEETRESLQKASEALSENQASKAAAEGTRAQRDLEELRDEFQEQTSGQFS